MSDTRAKNFEGLLDLVSEASAALRQNHRLLSRTSDTESVIAAKQSHELGKSLEFLGRDLASGLVDLLEVPFDERAHRRVFDNSGLVLASEPERRLSTGRRAGDKKEVPA
jgi:hypothetical protein